MNASILDNAKIMADGLTIVILEDETSVILSLGSASDGGIAEASGGNYSGNAKQVTRQDNIKLLYFTANWETASGVLQKYNIRYVYIGSLERTTYSAQEEKLRAHLKIVFQQGNVTIYEFP